MTVSMLSPQDTQPVSSVNHSMPYSTYGTPSSYSTTVKSPVSGTLATTSSSLPIIAGVIVPLLLLLVVVIVIVLVIVIVYRRRHKSAIVVTMVSDDTGDGGSLYSTAYILSSSQDGMNNPVYGQCKLLRNYKIMFNFSQWYYQYSCTLSCRQ